MKVLLLSLSLQSIPKKLKTGSKILFIPAGGYVYENPYFIENDYEQLIKFGYTVIVTDIRNNCKTYKELVDEGIDAIFVAGGNTFYLLDLLKQTGFDKTIKEWIQNDNLYIGTSAGSVIMGFSIEHVKSLDDETKASSMQSYEALGIVKMCLLPHYNKEKNFEEYHSIMKKYSQFAIKTIMDTEGLFFTSSKEYKTCN